MNYVEEIIKVYEKNPLEGVTANAMVNTDGIIFRKNGLVVNIYTNGNLTVYANQHEYTENDAPAYLAAKHPDIWDIVQKVKTDFFITKMCRDGLYESFLFPDLLNCEEEKVDAVVSGWKEHMGYDVCLSKEQKRAFYWKFFVVGRKNEVKDFEVDEVSQWLSENHIRMIKTGTFIIKLTIKDGIVSAALNTDRRNDVENIRLSDYADAGQCFENILKFVSDKIICS